MGLNRLFSFFAMCISYLTLMQGQNVNIKGVAPAHHGKEISLYTYNDLITYTETKTVFDTVDEKGHFELKLDVYHPQAVELKIGNLKGKLYLEPYFQYGIIFPGADTARFTNPNTEQEVDISIVGDSTELNARIIDFNSQFDEFWYNNYKAFVSKRLHNQLDSFQLSCNKRYEKVRSKYFKTYVNYSFALMNENTGRHHNYLAVQYLAGHPIHYYNFEYMQFFNQFFKQYLQVRVISKSGQDIPDIINENGDYNLLDAVLKTDPILKGDSLRELVILKNLYELYYVPKYRRERVLAMIKQLQQQSRVEEHKKIAESMLNIFSEMQPGAPAPAFKLRDVKGVEHALSDYAGKYVYLEFFASWSTASLQEMKKLEQIKNKYGDKVVFISISIDDTLSDFKNFVKNNPKYNWLLLHEGNGEIKQRYNIKTAPAYFFIGREGSLMLSPAPRPSEGIEFRFKQLFKEKSRRP